MDSLIIGSLTITGPLLTGSSSRTIVSSSMIVGLLMIIGSLLMGSLTGSSSPTIIGSLLSGSPDF